MKDFLDESTESVNAMQKQAKKAMETPKPVGGGVEHTQPVGDRTSVGARDPVGYGGIAPEKGNDQTTQPVGGGMETTQPVGDRTSVGAREGGNLGPGGIAPGKGNQQTIQTTGAEGQPSSGQNSGPSQTPKNQPVGFGDDKPQFLPDTPENMPGATEWEVDEDQTVAGQLAKNLSKDSPLFEVLEGRAQQNAAQRGLKNSLMALTAGELATVSKAFEISSQDAATFARSAEFNALTKNQFAQAEQAFMQSAMLSEQNFKQASKLQQEQIKGQIDQISAQIQGQSKLAEQQQGYWLQQSGIMHAQNLEAMELNHVLDVERLGVVQDYSLEAMAFQTENQMALSGWNADLQAALMDRGFMQDLQRNEQQFGFQQQLSYQQGVFGMLNTETMMIGQIGASGASPEQSAGARDDIERRTTLNLDLWGSFFGSPGGPAAQAGITGPPSQDYTYYGDAPSAQPGSGTSYGGSGSAGGSASAPGGGGGGPT